jgi:coatomer subunit beta
MQYVVYILQELVMDILRVLNSPDQEVRKKTLNLALDLVTSRSVEEVNYNFSSFLII